MPRNAPTGYAEKPSLNPRRVLKAERKLYRIAYSILWNDQDCCDAAQETMAKAWQYKDKLYSEAYFDTWLVRILINECRKLLKKRSGDVSELDEDIPAPSRDRERDIDLADALLKLPEKYRLPTLLHYLEGYSLFVAEVASTVNEVTSTQ